ncbi:MAG: CPXCG motif-containing cysteine-rich protein [Rhodanobacter sp.]
MLDEHIIVCPYCGESIAILIDASIPAQQYIEDCQVCCRPITLSVSVEEDGASRVRVSAENDS